MIITNEHSALSIGGEGANVEWWQIGEKDLFYRQRRVLVGDRYAIRGGLHPCGTNFGDREASQKLGLPSHGPIRQTSLAPNPGWTGSWASYSFVSKPGTNDLYPFAYTCDMALEAKAKGFSHWMYFERQSQDSVLNSMAMPFCAGIHPYFPVHGFCTVILDEEHLQITGPAVFGPRVVPAPKDPIRIMLSEIGEVKMTLSGYDHLVLWSDNRNRYLCVEPVFGVPGQFGTEQGNYLGIGQENGIRLDCEFEYVYH